MIPFKLVNKAVVCSKCGKLFANTSDKKHYITIKNHNFCAHCCANYLEQLCNNVSEIANILLKDIAQEEAKKKNSYI